MPTLIHHRLPAGTQLELLNVAVQVARRDNDDPNSDYIIVFEDAKEQVKVYVPMGAESYRKWVEALHANLSGVVLPDRPRLAIPQNGKR